MAKKKESKEPKKAPEVGSAASAFAPRKRGIFGSFFWLLGETVWLTSALVFGTVIGALVGVLFPLFIPGSLIRHRYGRRND